MNAPTPGRPPPFPPPGATFPQYPPRQGLPAWPWLLGASGCLLALVVLFVLPLLLGGAMLFGIFRAVDSAEEKQAEIDAVIEGIDPPEGYTEVDRREGFPFLCSTDCDGTLVVYAPAAPSTSATERRRAASSWVDGSGVLLRNREETESFLDCVERIGRRDERCILQGRDSGFLVTFTASVEDYDPGTGAAPVEGFHLELGVGDVTGRRVPATTSTPTTPTTR